MTRRAFLLVIVALSGNLWARGGGMLPRGRGDGLRARLDSLERLPPNMRYYDERPGIQFVQPVDICCLVQF